MTAKEFREKESTALQTELTEKQRHLYDLRSQSVTEKLEDPTQLKKARKDIARIKTILHERKLKDEKEQKAQKQAQAQPAAAVPATA